ncbi:tryptophan--tRNA ligase [Enterobacteriaceae endosymbiont of Neohaemonia nigricornis]|uniref:tryptophan--tRNA ligase n=1 Tax=Enterobacteriaceae endosymbiont of Neohaemonia nigricornis TaxID=2675792 RepID=UPI00144A0636|nr:tryptophan--tRNA ligase [Enterobacteriaceae endosymbiont of Neohaemonia nigricornis]QJC30527.1 tryptophan--tRNA ligase [Enterobacteriaceae endosymbiont of Neohaemonia nigricornis]
MSQKSIVFSGIQPTGELTIGNYIGALSQWKLMQKKYFCIYCIADLHALTNIQHNNVLQNNILDTLSILLACDIDPLKNIIFLQSDIPYHNQLNWILNCFTHFGELNRMTQFKNKKIYNQQINVGLFNYPILMASDILLYQATKIPVGKDQIQHLELTRTIANRFNNIYGKIFNIPTQIVKKYGNSIMSLLNPLKKMSKSDTNKNNIISLFDNNTTVKKKILHAVTDSDNPPLIIYNTKSKPGISNLLNILSNITNISIKKLEIQFHNKSYMDFKFYLVEKLCTFLTNLRKKYNFYRQNEEYLNNILNNGSKKAKTQALITLNKVYKSLGIRQKSD